MIRSQTNTKKSEQKFEINMSQNYVNTGCLIWTYLHFKIFRDSFYNIMPNDLINPYSKNQSLI